MPVTLIGITQRDAVLYHYLRVRWQTLDATSLRGGPDAGAHRGAGIMMEQARLTNAANAMDTIGNRMAKTEIAIAKFGEHR